MKHMSPDEMDRIVQEHFGYEAHDDLEGVLRTFSEDAQHEIVGGPEGRLHGKAALRDFYDRLFRDLRGESAEPLWRQHGNDTVVDVTLWTGVLVDGRPFRLDGRSGRASFRILHQFRFEDGLIAEETVWYDHHALEQQLNHQTSASSTP